MTDAELSEMEWLDERAAILEYEAGVPRERAERLAQEMRVDWAHNRERRHVD